MNEAIRNPVITNCHHGPAISAELPGEVFTRRVITVVLAAITALTFAFGFGNVWALGRSLGVPPFVAPLVGPAVDLSVAGLLIGIRHLSLTGVPRDQLRPARILLGACGVATLALNIAGPVAAGAYGRAAFDSVGPGLLIGWAETGPGMLRSLYAGLRDRGPAPDTGQTVDDGLPDITITDQSLAGSGSKPVDPSQPGIGQAGRVLEELLPQARKIDAEHRLLHHRPVSAETLRKQMRIGSMRARALVEQVRGTADNAVQTTTDRGRESQQGEGATHDRASEDGQPRAPSVPRELVAVGS